MEFYICCPKNPKWGEKMGYFWVTDKNPIEFSTKENDFTYFWLYPTAENYMFNQMDKNLYWQIRFVSMFETLDFTVTKLKMVEMK